MENCQITESRAIGLFYDLCITDEEVEAMNNGDYRITVSRIIDAILERLESLLVCSDNEYEIVKLHYILEATWEAFKKGATHVAFL